MGDLKLLVSQALAYGVEPRAAPGSGEWGVGLDQDGQQGGTGGERGRRFLQGVRCGWPGTVWRVRESGTRVQEKGWWVRGACSECPAAGRWSLQEFRQRA